ncbi:hypothetical protein T484DRAFT_1951271 [Baffinella frigidus]|nr:hypothetical protein T484DRAFT_1951271 [Cryptophyta sp. CCMP2293]
MAFHSGRNLNDRKDSRGSPVEASTRCTEELPRSRVMLASTAMVYRHAGVSHFTVDTPTYSPGVRTSSPRAENTHSYTSPPPAATRPVPLISNDSPPAALPSSIDSVYHTG